MAVSSIMNSFDGVHILGQTPRTLRELLRTATLEDLEWQRLQNQSVKPD